MDEDALTRAIIALGAKYGRYGYRRITALLRSAGWEVGKDRVQRIWRQEGLKVPQKQRPRGRLWLNDGFCVRLRPERPNHVWSYDFMNARTHEGRTLRLLTLLDEYTRECLAIRVERRMGSQQIIEALSDVMLWRGIPEQIRSDNGPEFIAKQLRQWLAKLGTATLYIEPGSPWENGCCESFNLNSVFHLNLRTTQGFLQSIVALMALDLPVPNYSTVSRRQSAVDVRLSVGPTDRPRHVVIDSTGLKIYGAGEWHIRKHRTLRRRTWRKLHLGVDETTKEMVAMDLTASNVHDARRLSSLLSKTPGSIGQVSADRAYDTGSCYEAVLQHDAIVTILPRRNARCSRDSHPPPWRGMRDTHLRRIRTQGRYEWRKSSGCTRQSVAENAVSRYKAILGVSLSARTVKNQKVEAAIKRAVLNRMAELGMPRSERVY